MDIRDKVAVVTGAAGGIGAAVARRFAADGARAVVVADVDLERAQEVARECGAATATAVRCDVSLEADVRALVETARRQFGRIDVYVSNAGILRRGGLELDDELWTAMWRIHAMAHVWAARAVLPGMAAHGEGAFVVTASAAGLLSIVESAPYAVTKHAALGCAEWLRIAYGRQGVRVSCLCPQAVQTGMTGDGTGSAGLDGILQPEQVAAEVVAAIADGRFLVLPHPQVLDYFRHKAQDYERWLGGMQKLHARHVGAGRDGGR